MENEVTKWPDDRGIELYYGDRVMYKKRKVIHTIIF